LRPLIRPIVIMTDLKLEMPVAAEAGKSLVEAAKETIKDTMKK